MKLNPIYAFVDLIKENQKEGMVVAEIGTFDGTTTKHYIDIVNKNNGHLFAIDWFKGNLNVSGPHQYNENNKKNVLETFISNVEPYFSIVTIKDGISSEMIPEIPDNSLDICFIDADHRYSYVYSDIKLCLTKMKPNGIICGHDCEDITLANSFPKEWLEIDTVNKIHYGTIQAVFDHFGTDVEIISDPKGQGINLWVKRLN